MDTGIRPIAEQFSVEHIRHQRWQKVVTFLAAIVVFCTTYALILPAITWENQLICELEEHTHTDECYEEVTVPPGLHPTCGIAEHVHGDDCWEEQKVLICGMAETEPHTHTDECYDETGALICPLREITAEEIAAQSVPFHRHSEDCFDENGDLVCGKEETAAPALHKHTAECYTEKKTPVCGKEEIPAHIHSEECFGDEMQPVLVCTLEEHTHTDVCYTEKTVLLCTKEECLGHTHTDGCYTEEKKLVCTEEEREAHIHTEACYEERTTLVCTLDESEGHAHTEDCYDADGNLICDTEESEGHTHGDDCYQTESVLVCEREETEGHTHTDECCETERVLTCTEEEREGHMHSEECWGTEKVLLCTLEESEGHTHGEDCYEMRPVPLCGTEETEGHTHSDACYETTLYLSCTENAAPVHIHTEDCYRTETFLVCGMEEHTHEKECLSYVGEHVERVLICGKEEHTHTTECFDAPPAYDDGRFCNQPAHVHSEECYHEDGTLLCTLAEHEHTLACESDIRADVESAGDWEASFADISLSGNVAADAVEIAKTQIGYEESQKNFAVENETVKMGYTRYGAWFDSPYAGWDAVFCAFCYSYADADDTVPLFGSLEPWMLSLQENEKFRSPGMYAPKPGDLVFRDEILYAEDGTTPVGIAQHIGILESVLTDDDGNATDYMVIEGDCGDRVAEVLISADSTDLIGFGEMPGERNTRVYEDERYKITVGYGENAGIPDEAELKVELIPYGGDEYWEYYRQSVDAMIEAGYAREESELAVSFIQFFDIGFEYNGEKLEPRTPVDLVITCKDDILMNDAESGGLIHFGDSGTEILEAEEVRSEEDGSLEAFAFTQNGFSISGLILINSVPTPVYEQRKVFSIDQMTTGDFAVVCLLNSGGKVLGAMQNYTGNAGYTLARQPLTAIGGGTSFLAGSSVTLWTPEKVTQGSGYYTTNYIRLKSENAYLVLDYNGLSVTYNSSYASLFTVEFQNDGSFLLRTNDGYLNSSGGSPNIIKYSGGDPFWLYSPCSSSKECIVWLDGTDGQLMNLLNSPDVNYTDHLTKNADGTYSLVLPTTWTPPSKQDYTLAGWYDIYNHTYYEPGDTAVVSASTVFYADWKSSSYDFATENDDPDLQVDTPSVATDKFITTYVFDYSPMFNVYSEKVEGVVGKNDHSEIWTLLHTGTAEYSGEETLNLIFRDWDTTAYCFTYPANCDTTNTVQSSITSGIVQDIANRTGKDITELLFDPLSDALGVSYLGEGKYLYNYNEDTGFYYYDSYVNAASYNQTAERFFVYDYVERTSDSLKDEVIPGTADYESGYTDFLPFNSPYQEKIQNGDVDVVTYNDNNSRRLYPQTNYQFDAKYDEHSEGGCSALNNAGTNYFFGFRSDIDFYLPNDSNYNLGKQHLVNQSTHGDDLQFRFAGDDDIWVYVDDEFVLDIGGLHGVRSGMINFATGEITVEGTVVKTLSFAEGEHTLTMYYMERGSSQANCRVFFNISPRYDLEMTKSDAYDVLELLDGAVFAFYENEACTTAAKLWNSEEDYENGESSVNTFRITDGKSYCWGLSPGHTYYIKEVQSPNVELYGQPDDTIKIKIDSRGNATFIYEGENGEQSVGVVGYRVDPKTLAVDLSVTNRKEGTTCLTIKKKWADGNVTHAPINVQMTEDGVPTGAVIELNAECGWEYTWIGIPLPPDGVDFDEYYNVIEYPIPAFYYPTGTVITKNTETGFYECTLTNAKIPDSNLTEVPVKKLWSDGTTVPHEAIVVHLYADGEDTGRTLTLNASNGWKGTFDGLMLNDPYSSKHPQIEYTVEEEEVTGYIGTVECEYTSNTQTQPETVTTYTTRTITGNYGLNNDTVLRLCDSTGTYALAIDGSGHLASQKVQDGNEYQLWVVKNNTSNQWDNATLSLMNKKTGIYLILGYNTAGKPVFGPTDITLNSITDLFFFNNNILSTWNGSIVLGSTLGITEKGLGTTMKIQEAKTETKNVEHDESGWEATITNERVPAVQIDISKIWADGDYRHRKSSVTVTLLADGEETEKTLTLKADNEWAGSFKNLPRYREDGKTEIEYTVAETPVEGYISRIKLVDSEKGELDCHYTYTVTNRPAGPEMPATGGNGTRTLLLYALGVLIITGVIMAGCARRRRREGRYGD